MTRGPAVPSARGVGAQPRHRSAAAVVVAALLVGASVAVGPAATADPSPSTVIEDCAPEGAITQTGTPLVSGPMAKALSTLELPVDVHAVVTQQVQPGGTVTSVESFTFDLGAKAHDVLVDQVRPAVVASGYPQLAPGAWVVLTLVSSTIRIPLPAGAAPVGQPVSTSPTVGTSAAWDGSAVVVSIGTVAADTRLGTGTPTTVTVGWREADGGAAAPRVLDLDAPSLSFRTSIDVGVSFAGSPLVGGVDADWACEPPAGSAPIASTTVLDGTPPVATEPTLPVAGPPPVISPPVAVPPQTWPASATEPTDCTVSGFDRYGGWSGLQLDATGAFRTEQVDGRWWLVDPLGHPFFSQGINNVTYAGTPDRNGLATYHDSAVARYGTVERWADAQVERFAQWGYNTAGAWSDQEIQQRMPYALLVGFTSQSSSTGVMEDLWSPAWISSVAARAAEVAAEHADDPNLVGYWTDNELHWGPDWRPAHLFDEYLADPAAAPGKQALLAWLQARYSSFSAFAADFSTAATSWAELAAPTTLTSWTPAGGQATRNAWTGVVAEQYFSVTVGSMRAADPVHLQLGPRFIAQTTGRPILEAAARWVDVASFNDYAIDPALLPGLKNADPTYLSVEGGLAAQAAVLGTPILVSEWGFRAADSGLLNTWPPLFPTLQTQGQRAGAYQQFAQSLLDTTWVVGQHWFEHADEPLAGRFDGEDSNFGLVDLHDDPYAAVVEVSRWMHDCAYARLLDPVEAPTTTTPVTATTTAPAGSSDAPVPAMPVAAEPGYTG